MDEPVLDNVPLGDDKPGRNLHIFKQMWSYEYLH